MASNKEIEVLNDREHVLLRPTVYVGSVKPTEEKIPIIKEGKIFIETRSHSVGMYKLFDEVFSNSLDEAKRMKGKMKTIKVMVDSKKNTVTIQDQGGGFYKGASKNKVTGVSNIETAVSMLKAGSNFRNENDGTEETLVGTNGMGVALVCFLSSEFSIVSVNKEHYYAQTWHDAQREEPKVEPANGRPTGTAISFKPLRETFGNTKFDKEVLKSVLILKNILIKKDPLLKGLKIEFYWDGEEISLEEEFYPKDAFVLETAIGFVVVWESFEGGGSLAAVNSAFCTGIHQRMINDYINQKLEDTLGHHFYDTFLVLNLAPKYVKFGDQNKTRFVTPKYEIESLINFHFQKKIEGLFKTPLFARILKKVEDRKREGQIKKFKAEKKKVNVKHSTKYLPACKSNAENLFIVEGNSAAGSIAQKRDPLMDGVYALKGKIRNCRDLSDLAENKEIIEICQVLGLDPTVKTQTMQGYKRVVIAADSDPDGSHITSLIINLFRRWFPTLVKEGKITLLRTPLVSVGSTKREYFFTLDEFKKSSSRGNTRYLKGLGSLDLVDWEFVMKNKSIIDIQYTEEDMDILDMAFGDSAEARKKWLSQF
jgi:DNA gyrase/topoisomerase IV subunit B